MRTFVRKTARGGTVWKIEQQGRWLLCIQGRLNRKGRTWATDHKTDDNAKRQHDELIAVLLAKGYEEEKAEEEE